MTQSPADTLTITQAIDYLRDWVRNAPEPQDGYYRLKEAIGVVVDDTHERMDDAR